MRKIIILFIIVVFYGLFIQSQNTSISTSNNNKITSKDSIKNKKIKENIIKENIIKEKELRRALVLQRKKHNDSLLLNNQKGKTSKDSTNYKKSSNYDDLLKYKNDRLLLINQRIAANDSLFKARLDEVKNKNSKKPSKLTNIKTITEPIDPKTITVSNDSIKEEPLIITENTNFKTIFDEGKKEMENEDYEKALEHFNECVKRKYYDVYSIYYKGITLRKLKRYDEAIEAFRDLYGLDNTYYITFFEIGKIHLEKKEYPFALYNFNEFAKENPHSHETKYYKARVYLETNKNGLALEEITNAIKEDDKNGAYFLLSGKIRLAMKLTNQACVDFRKAADLKDTEATKYIYENCLKK